MYYINFLDWENLISLIADKKIWSKRKNWKSQDKNLSENGNEELHAVKLVDPNRYLKKKSLIKKSDRKIRCSKDKNLSENGNEELHAAELVEPNIDILEKKLITGYRNLSWNNGDLNKPRNRWLNKDRETIEISCTESGCAADIQSRIK